MAASKWRLTKKDEKEIQEEVGKSGLDGAEAEELRKTLTRECKQKKADAAAAKKGKASIPDAATEQEGDLYENDAVADGIAEAIPDSAAHTDSGGHARCSQPVPAGPPAQFEPPGGNASPVDAGNPPVNVQSSSPVVHAQPCSPPVIPAPVRGPHASWKTLPSAGANKDYFSQVQVDIETIFGVDAFANIMDQKPLPVTSQANAQCGVQAPFSANQCETALRRQGTYISGFNLFWISPVHSSQPGIPLSRKRVQELSTYLFSEGPKPLTWLMTVVVPTHDANVLNLAGTLRMVSPEEMLHAVLLALADDIRAGADRATLRKWKSALLSVPVCP